MCRNVGITKKSRQYHKTIDTRQYHKLNTKKFQNGLKQAFSQFKEITDPNVALQE